MDNQNEIAALVARLDSMSEEEMAAELARLSAGSPPPEEKQAPPPPAQQVEWTMSDGTVIKAGSAAELAQLVQSHQPRPAEPRQQADKPDFDYKLYTEKFLKDPRDAQRYMEKSQYGVSMDELIPQMGVAMQAMARQLQDLQEKSFQSQISDAGQRRIVDDLSKQLGVNRDLAFELAQSRGLLEKPEEKASKSGKPFVPPRMSSSQGQQQQDEPNLYGAANALSDENLQELMLQKGLITKRQW